MATGAPTREATGGGRPPTDHERELVLAARTSGADRERLIEAFLPLIGTVARMYRTSPAVDRRELMQEGVVGLLRALERYDAELGTPFWAYASWWVRQAMQQLVSELTGPVVLSDRAARHLARVKAAQRRHLQEQGREPSRRELADATGLPHSQVDALIAAERRPRGLEQPVRIDDWSSGVVGETLADPRAEHEYERVSESVAAEQLPAMLDDLSERERTVVRGRFGLDGREQTLRELASALGLSAERVRQIEGATLGKLRAACGVPA
jgi:RNA polymerase sigma factor (sigma-70 family)